MVGDLFFYCETIKGNIKTMKSLYCTGFSASVIGTENKTQLVYRPRCKQWSCDYCAIQNMKAWRWRIANEIGKLKNENVIQNTWFFWTMTLSGEYHDKTKPRGGR